MAMMRNRWRDRPRDGGIGGRRLAGFASHIAGGIASLVHRWRERRQMREELQFLCDQGFARYRRPERYYT